MRDLEGINVSMNDWNALFSAHKNIISHLSLSPLVLQRPASNVKLPSHAMPHTIRYTRGGAAAVWGARVSGKIWYNYCVLHAKCQLTTHVSLFLSPCLAAATPQCWSNCARRKRKCTKEQRQRERSQQRQQSKVLHWCLVWFANTLDL
jgi:hypothetical protein